TTMERGIGRCEEEMIFTICALRSAGIPARYCSAPCWCTADGNHAWTEVYTGKEEGWRYLGSCEPAACLDQAWFTRVASRTGAVLSAGYGEAPVPDEYAEALYRQADGVTTLNSIGVYNDPGTLVLAFPEGHGAPAREPDESDEEAPDAYAHTFNWGGLVPLVRQALGTEILLGPGDYLVTAEIDSQPWSALATIRSGQETSLELAPGFAVLDEPIWLRYPMPEDGQAGSCPIEDDDPVWLRHQRDIARKDLDRCRRSHPSTEWIEFLSERPETVELDEQMRLAGPLTADWMSAVLTLHGDTLEIAVDLLLEMDLKDFYEVNREGLGDILGEVLRVRDISSSDVPDSLWTEFVLSPRLYFQEGTMDWWTALPWLGRNEDAPSATDLLKDFRGHVTKIETARLGPVATPEDTWHSGYASPASARACLVGLLRRHGIPAKAERGVDYAEAWENESWVRFVPFEEDVEDTNGGPPKQRRIRTEVPLKQRRMHTSL
ncbi:transglutaminase-like domain-containing protein, partial [bacterium]|nr:transglutaminase-like domain-containing protein [bacterium]